MIQPALTYHNFKTEAFVREAQVKRHNRDEFLLVTKFPPRMLKSKEDQDRLFNEQIERCGVEYFDNYLLPNIGVSAYEQACRFDTFGFVQRKKREGNARNVGMSFHDAPELLDEILTAHPELDLVQFQINDTDWESTGIQSRRYHEVARKHDMPIIVMEPCKG